MNDYRILVVDDEEDLCEILKFNLENEGYEVDTQKITRLRARCRQVFGVSLPEVLWRPLDRRLARQA